MIWHVVRIMFREDVDEEERSSCENAIRAMCDDMPDVLFCRVSRALDAGPTTMVVSGFRDEAALRAYYDDPRQNEMFARVSRLREGLPTVIDAWTNDRPDMIPKRESG